MKRVVLRRVGLALAATALVALAVVTVLRVLGSWELARSAERFEAAVGPLDFKAYRPPSVPDGENAALPILEALDRIDAHTDPDWHREIEWLGRANHRPAADWSEEDWRRADAALATGRDVLEPLHRAVGRSRSSFQLHYSTGPQMEIRILFHALEAATLLFAQARVAWQDGRPDDGAAAVEALSTLSRALQVESPLFFQLMGHTVEVLQYRAIRDAVEAPGWGSDARRTFVGLRATTGKRPRGDYLRATVGTEGTFLYSVRPGGEHAGAVSDELPWLQSFAYRWRGYGTVAAGLDYYVRFVQAYPSLTAARMAEDQGTTAPPRDGKASSLVRDLRLFLRFVKVAESLRRLARLALDLESEGAEWGTLPESLPSAPAADPFAGAVTVYRRAPDGSATLSIPGAEELWSEPRRGRVRQESETPLFTWSLAAPSGSPPG